MTSQYIQARNYEHVEHMTVVCYYRGMFDDDRGRRRRRDEDIGLDWML